MANVTEVKSKAIKSVSLIMDQSVAQILLRTLGNANSSSMVYESLKAALSSNSDKELYSQVKVSVQTEEKVTGYNLELSANEAQTVLDITRRVSGDPKNSRRGLTDSIGNAFKGILSSNYSAQGTDITTSLNFSDLS